eukprot:1902691-Prymnesium_polylepis.2
MCGPYGHSTAATHGGGRGPARLASVPVWARRVHVCDIDIMRDIEGRVYLQWGWATHHHTCLVERRYEYDAADRPCVCAKSSRI